MDSWRAPLSSSHRGSFQYHASRQTSAWEPLEEQDKGPGGSNPEQHWPCPVSCMWADSLEPIFITVALSPADGPVLGAPGLEPHSWG